MSEVFTIEGKEFTARQLAKMIGKSRQTAMYRLRTYKTIEELLGAENSNLKTYTIEGKGITVLDIMREAKCGINTARSRLREGRCKTLKELFRPLGEPLISDKVQRARKNQTYKRHPANAKLLNPEDLIFKLTYGKWS